MTEGCPVLVFSGQQKVRGVSGTKKVDQRFGFEESQVFRRKTFAKEFVGGKI